MKKRQILKALSLLAAICIAAGCNASTAVETTSAVDITATTTAEITTASAEVMAETEAGQGEIEEINGKKYCKIPEGMTFEDLCGLVYYKDTQLHFPCTIDEILALNENWGTDKFYGKEGGKDAAQVYDYSNSDKGQYVCTLGTISDGNLEIYEDVSLHFHFSTDYTEDAGFTFNGVKNGTDMSEIKSVFGEPIYEDLGYSCYEFMEDAKEAILEFRFKDNKFTGIHLTIRRV